MRAPPPCSNPGHTRLHMALCWVVYGVLGWAVWATPVAAQNSAVGGPQGDREIHLFYEAMWGGAHVADFTLSQVRGGDGKYQIRFALETRGLTRWLSGFSVISKARGRWVTAPNGLPSSGVVNAAGAPAAVTHLPEHYGSVSASSKHIRWVEIDFPASREAAVATTGTKPNPDSPDNWNPKDKGPETLDKIDDKQRTGVMDPISTAAQLMAGIEAHLKGGPAHFTIKGFDGRRRFNFNVEYLGLADRTVDRKKYNTYHVRVTPDPIAGFKERHRKLWDGATYDFYLLRDGSFTPVQITPLKHGPVLNLVRRCKKPCELKAED